MQDKKNVIIIRLNGTILLVVYICLHFFLSYYRYELENNKVYKLDFGFGITRPYNISLTFFIIGCICIAICFVFLKKEWKIPILLFSILYIVHFCIFVSFNVIYVDLIFWSSLSLIGTIVVFYNYEGIDYKAKRIQQPKYRGVLS